MQTQTISFADIMAEELAAKIQREEEEKEQQMFWKQQKQNNLYSIPEDEDEQLRLALELSAIEASESISNYNTKDEEEVEKSLTRNNVPKENGNEGIPSQEDQDFLYALQLQNNLDAQQYVEYLQAKERLVKDSLSKVSVSYEHKLPDFLRNVYDDEECNQEQIYQKEDDSEEEEEDEEYYEEENLTKPVNPDEIIGMKPYHQVSKVNGRQPAKEIITKHDLINDGLKNSVHLESMVDSGNLTNVALSGKVFNSLKQEAKRTETHKTRVRGNKLDLATQDQVMDQRTRVALLQLLNSEGLGELHGVINTGKEANVYHGMSPIDPEDGSQFEYAVKIFKTTLNEFKNRADYVEGEFRFRHKLSRQNPRKLIKLWAEKEMRNLKRMESQNIPCPTPIRLRENILVMSFIGKNGYPAPTLKDAPLTLQEYSKCYQQCIKHMRQIYHKCKLVHGDLSEFNLLYYKNKIWFIDVSQAIEHDHPRALEFLRRDCTAIFTFFSKKGVTPCLTARQLFDFITDISIETEEEENSLLKQFERENSKKSISHPSNEDTIVNNMFHSQNTFIPRTLGDVPHPHNESEIFYEAVTGLKEKGMSPTK